MPPTLSTVVAPLGTAPGVFVTADPSGRYVLLRGSEGVLTAYDTHDALAPVFSCHPLDDAYATALHPSGRALARITYNWVLELRQEGREPIRQVTEIGSSSVVDSEMSRRWGVHGAGWLQFTADGRALVVGDVAEQARIGLHDPETLKLLDRIDRITGVYPREPIVAWGEGAIVAVAPEGAVAFAANVGDDVVVLGVVEVAELAGGGLRGYGVSDEPVALSSKVPGEVIHGICIAEDDLYVVDSDGCLTRVRWREDPSTAQCFASAYELFDEGEPTVPELEGLREWGLEAPAERPIFTDICVWGDAVLVVVQQERVHDDLLGWAPQALLAFDRGSLAPRGWAALPEAEIGEHFDFMGGGTLCKTDGEETSFWRITP